MRKLLLTIMAILGIAFATNAQVSKTVTNKTTATKPTIVVNKKVVRNNGTVVSKRNHVVLKKDGTPDKRYKASKTVVLRKDGTPDRRYKVNKKVTVEKK